MCGFVALIQTDQQPASEATLDRMLASIVHRGPDDAGKALLGSVGLGFRRLSILDLSPSGHQPMQSQDGRYTIVFNGEIYNFIELRGELQALGHRFHSTGDTEVLLAAYLQWGDQCLSRLNGMWAFVIHDKQTQTLFGSRDRMGIKPLYRYQDRERMLFASEIKAIRHSGVYTDRLDPATCAAYLYEGRLDQDEASFYQDIVPLPAGHAFVIDAGGSYRQWRYWSVDDMALEDVANPAERFAELFEDAMRLHLRSDVPLAVNLSGGLDSTAIICAAARSNAAAGSSERLLAFSYMDERFDERRYIDDTLAQTGAEIVPLRMTPRQLWDSLPQVLAYQDEPVHSMTALVGFHLMGLAQSHGIKVVLNGQGADETLAGYGNYFNDYWTELAGTGHLGEMIRQMRAYAQGHGKSLPSLLQRTLRHTLQTKLRASPAYRAAALRRRRAAQQATDWLNPALLASLPERSQASALGLRASLSDSVQRTPLPLYLRIEDRNSMAHSVEARLPFLDYRLVSFLFSLDSRHKLDGPWNKQLMRQGLKGLIPESVRTRIDKMGFPTSAASWFRNELKEPLQDILSSRAMREHDWIRVGALQKKLAEHVAGAADHSGTLFTSLQFHLWQQASRS